MEKLFYQDPEIKEFTAVVTGCQRAETGWEVTLDATAFYPTGGGQACDLGTLGNANVLDVSERGEEIIHLCDGPFEVGSAVTGKIDWARRFDLMQQHTGEHIVSGIIHKLYGHQNSGFHVGEELMEVDFDGPLPEGALEEIQRLANEAVWADYPVNCYVPSPEELPGVVYRTKRELPWPVRIVEIPGVDVCACCAPHVKTTGEIGIIEVVSFEKYKGGTRVSILCGERALSDIRAKLNENRKISALTCAKQKETAKAVERLKQENENLKYEITGLNREILSSMADTIEPQDKIITFDKRLEGKLLIDFTISLMGKAGKFASSFCGENESYRYCIASNNVDLRPLSKAINEAFSGRGGGKPEIVQGSLCGTQTEIEKFLSEYEI